MENGEKMGFESIPENKKESFPCDCGGNITQLEDNSWACDSCEWEPPTQTKPKFNKVSCSQCGGEFGPRDSGFSHCEDHKGLKNLDE